MDSRLEGQSARTSTVRRVGRVSIFPGLAVLGVLVLLVWPTEAQSQIRASERAMVSQTVDGTVITVEYSRPRARGRTELFGGVVHWGEVWTPGANDATVLELNEDVEIEGQGVPEGRWSVWMVVAEDEPWELVLDPRDSLFHTERPEVTAEQIRFPVEVEEAGFVDVLTWSFPRVRNDGTTLVMSWGPVRVPLEVEVEPSMVMTVGSQRAVPYVGDWRITSRAPPDREPPPAQPFRIEYDEENERLMVRTIFPTPEGPRDVDLLLAPAAEGIFTPVILSDEGEVMNVTQVMLEFEFRDDRAVAFALRTPEDDVVATGRRGSVDRVPGATKEDVVLDGKTVDWLVASAVLAAPEPLREGAEVRGWTADDRLVTLREGSNGTICLADRADREGFQAACYHESLEPFMARGRELSRNGVNGAERNRTRWKEIEAGTLPMPEAAMVYNLRFASQDFHPAATDPATGSRLHAIYIPGATPESTGLSPRPGEGPWLMLPGTPQAHVMIGIPAREPR